MLTSRRLRFFLSHLGLSALVIGTCAALVLLVWYPGALAGMEGTYPILIMMIIVDVGIGPVCTLVAAAPGKGRAELARDLTVIALVQLSALGYAMYTCASARPAYIVYSFNAFSIEDAPELSTSELAKASRPEFAQVPWLGPLYVEARLPTDKARADEIILSTMHGELALKDMPQYYLPWAPLDTKATKQARKVSDFWEKGELRPAAVRLLEKNGLTEADGVVLPIRGKVEMGNVVLRRSDLAVLGIIPKSQ